MKFLTIAAAATLALTAPLQAAELPGKGVTVHPIKGSPANAWFQHMVVQLGLEALGYEVEETREADFPALHLAVSSGDADYTVNNWKPLHDDFYEKSGGDSTMIRTNAVITGAGQGYFIDRKTAEAHGIKTLDQFRDPEIAALFDADDDGLANLSGCNPGWGCELKIEEHLDTYDLRETIEHDQGSYFAIMADTITRYNEGGSILYYTWTPNWISDVLVPGEDVVQIGIPGDGPEMDPGFDVNDVYVVVNRAFAEENPAAARLLERVSIPLAAVNAAQVRLRDGEDKIEDFRRQAEDWVAANQEEFDGWVADARSAAE